MEAAILPETCAVMMEIIQGEAGINVPSAEYLAGVSALCKKHGILLIIDEVQTGMGRTGQGFAFQNFDMQPDIITLAKAVAGGFPMGVMLARMRWRHASSRATMPRPLAARRWPARQVWQRPEILLMMISWLRCGKKATISVAS